MNHINHPSDVHPTFTDVYFDDVKMTYVPTTILQYNEYYPFGLQTSTSWTRENSNNNFLGNGGSEMNTTSGLYDTYYRGYDPALGRFLQVDPLATSTNSMTPYQYANNNPAIFTDPNGDRAYVSMEDLLNPPIPGYGSGPPVGGGNPVMNWMLSLSGSGGSTYGKNGITNQGGYIYANSFNGLADENISNTTVAGIGFTYGFSSSVLSGTGYETGHVDNDGKYVKGERTYDDSRIVFAAASQGGSGLYSNETAAYRFMWNNSFRGGQVWRENYAFLTTKGVYVLPTEGLRKSNGKYGTNGPGNGYTDYVNTKKDNGKWFVQDQASNSWLEIIGSVHTHPNNSYSGLSGEDKGNIMFGPIIAFQSDYYYYGYNDNGGVSQGYTQGDVIGEELSLIGLVKQLPK